MASEERDESWFKKSSDYWKTQSPTVNGMLGGLGALSPKDIKGSDAFLSKYFPNRLEKNKTAMDVGAGIGRVSLNLLLNFFPKVSIIEANAEFCEQAAESIGEERLIQAFPIRFETFAASMSEVKFDLIWIQWVIIYASDQQFVRFLKEASKALKPGGLIGLKDNILSTDDCPEYDDQDHSVCRSEAHILELFREAGLVLLERKEQTGFPKHIYPVIMYMFKQM